MFALTEFVLELIHLLIAKCQVQAGHVTCYSLYSMIINRQTNHTHKTQHTLY